MSFPKCFSSANVSNNGAYSIVKRVCDHDEVYYIVFWLFGDSVVNSQECVNDNGKKSSFISWLGS